MNCFCIKQILVQLQIIHGQMHEINCFVVVHLNWNYIFLKISFFSSINFNYYRNPKIHFYVKYFRRGTILFGCQVITGKVQKEIVNLHANIF